MFTVLDVVRRRRMMLCLLRKHGRGLCKGQAEGGRPLAERKWWASAQRDSESMLLDSKVLVISKKG